MFQNWNARSTRVLIFVFSCELYAKCQLSQDDWLCTCCVGSFHLHVCRSNKVLKEILSVASHVLVCLLL